MCQPFHIQANWEIHHTDTKFMKPYQDMCAACEQNRDQLRSALFECDKDLLMKDGCH